MGLKEIYSAAGAKILGASTTAKVIGTVTVASAVIAGGAAGIHAYTNGRDFTPSGESRAMRTNQVHFDGDESTIGKQDESEQDKKSESKMYERDANAEEQAKPQTGDSASYLFDSEKQPETSANNTLFDGNGTAAAIAGTTVSDGAASTPPGTVIDIVSDPSKADMVIRPGTAGTITEPSAGEGGGNAEIPPVPAPHPLPNPDPTPEPPPAPSPNPKPSQPSKGDSSGGGSEPSAPVTPVTPPTASDIENSAKEDTSGSSEAPSTGGKDVEEIRYHESSADMGSNPGIYIGNRENNESGYLYCGQQITPEDIIRSLTIFISTQNSAGAPVAYYFTSDDLGTYLRIDSVTIDGAEIKEYPFTVPENSQTIEIKMSYRLKQSDEWTPYVERDIVNPLKSHRVLVLTDKLTEVGQTIPSDWIIRPDRSASERINLYGFQRALYDKRYGWDAALRIDLLPPLRELYTGWTENGEQAPWIYTADSGRHILQPGEFVEVPEGYTVRLTNKNYGEGNGGYYEWQTLTDFDESVLTTDENGETTLNVPEYVQAVALEGEAEPVVSTYAARGARPGNELHGTVCSDNVANYFVIPSTVDYIENDGRGNVMSGYIVDADNEKYAAVDGILTDKAETEYISIPLAKESITVPETITKVNLPDGYDGTVVLEGGTLPEINFENMLGGSVEVKDVDMMDKVVREYGKALSGNQSAISIDGSEQSYEVHSDCLTHMDEDGNTVLDRVITSAQTYTIPDNVQGIAPGAFAGSLQLQSILIPYDNDITLNAAIMRDNTNVEIVCVNPKKAEELTEQLDNPVRTAKQTADGCTYLTVGGTTMLLGVPKDVREFRGTIIDGDTELTVNVIGAHAFDGCKKLEYVSLPESVSEIGTSAFDGCTSLSGVMIEGTGAFTIKDHAFDGCTSLRFIGSNAMNMTLENDYNIVTGSGSGQISGELWRPTGNAGYNSAWLNFDDETGITGYKVYEMNGMKVLYGSDGESGSWLAIRAAATPSASAEQWNAVELPADTQEIYISCFEEIAVPYTINWESLENLWSLDQRAFADSGLTGTMKLASAENDIFLEDYVFVGSDLTEADFSAVTIYRGGSSMFADCQRLKKVTFGASTLAGPNTGNEGKPNSVIMSHTFFECNNLEEIAFTTDTPIGLSTYGPNDGFTFRDTYTDAALKITVPEGKADVYYEAWQRSFLGCDVNDPFDYLSYKSIMENQLFGDRMDFMDATWEVNEDNWNAYVEAYTQYTIRKAGNMLRGMLGMEKLEELENPQEHKEDYGGNASAGGDPYIWWSAQDTADTPVETPDAAPDDSPPDDPPKLDITISDPSENEIPSISAPSADAPAEQPSIDAPGEQPSAEPSAPSEQPSAPDTTTENTEPAADPSAAGEGETT